MENYKALSISAQLTPVAVLLIFGFLEIIQTLMAITGRVSWG